MAEQELIRQGAEARVYKTTIEDRPAIAKQRFSKGYRHPDLDQKLTRGRLNQEARSLKRCKENGIRVPDVLRTDKSSATLYMEFVAGPTLKEWIINNHDQQRETEIMATVGEILHRLHSYNIIHGDLTTSNMIVSDGDGELVLIDFGLSQISPSAEDKAVDLYVLERAFISTHPDSERLFAGVLEAYARDEAARGVLRRLEDPHVVSAADRTADDDAGYSQFEGLYRQCLEVMGLPEQLWKPLYQKLQTATYDIRDRVEVSSSDGKPRFGELKANLTDAELAAESDVFLLRSLWTTTATTALQSLENSPWLLEDMEGVTGVYEPQDGLPAMPDTSMSDESAEADVAAVMSQACVDEARARQLLQKTGGDIIEAIMAASETDTSVADQSSVQTQILQQLEAGGQDGQPLQWRTHNYECIQYSLDGTDQLDSIDIRLHLGQAVRASDIANTVTTTHIKVSVGDSVVLDGDLHAP
ncbi:serine/threonine-protein kinase bud32, partial [Coemansia sp. RSA 2704]